MTGTRERRKYGEQLLMEVQWRRYGRDVFAFIDECIIITVEDGSGSSGGGSHFEMYDYQRDLLRDMLTCKFIVAVKARQLGFTTLVMAYVLWLLMFKTSGANVLLMSKNDDSAAKNLAMVTQMYRYLPDWLKRRGPSLEADAKKSFSLRQRNGAISIIKSFPPTATTAAGESATLVVLDEFALYERVNPATVWNVVEPTTLAAASNANSNSVVCIMLSTPRSPDDVLARYFLEANNPAKKSRFKAVFVPASANRYLWTDGAFDQVKYDNLRNEKALLDREWEIYSEYPMTVQEAFLKSGHLRYTTFPDEGVEPNFVGSLLGGRDACLDGTAFNPSEDGLLRIWEKPRPDRFYVLSVDVAHGREKDYTVGQIHTYGDGGEPYIAAAWWSNITKDSEAAAAMANLGWYYHGTQHEALMVFDAGGNHAELMKHVWNGMSYTNFYYYTPQNARRGRIAASAGLNTAGASGLRPIILDRLGQALPMLGNIYPELRDEFSTFIIVNDRAEAQRGFHDDHVLCAAMAQYVLQERFIPPVVSDGRADRSEDAGHLDAFWKRINKNIASKKRAESKHYRDYARQIDRQDREKARYG